MATKTASVSLFCTTALAGWLAAATPAAGAGLSPPSVDVTTWPRMTSPAFGCYLEQTFGHRDPRFNCALKGYRNAGDVCKLPEQYYEGPAFPQRLAAKVHPLASDVALSWEHGELQYLTITLKGTWNEAEVRQAFRLPRDDAGDMTLAERRAQPKNVMTTSVQYSTPDDAARRTGPSDPAHGITLVSLTGFDHMGGGDVDCGDGR